MNINEYFYLEYRYFYNYFISTYFNIMFDFKFLLFMLYNYFAPLFCGLLFMIPMSISRVFSNNYIAVRIKNIMFNSIGYILHNIFSIKFYTNSNNLIQKMFTNDKQIMVIQNHLSEIDSLFYYSLFDCNYNSTYNTITLMKKAVAYQLLGIGIIDFYGNDVFLSRNIIRDSFNLNAISKKNNAVYLFPEGTVYTTETKARSDAFCHSQKLPIFDYVLYPRVTGISLIIKNNSIKKLYDITTMFDTMDKKKFGTYFSAQYFLFNGLPKNVMFNITKYDITSETINKEAEEIFKNKDKFIKKFNNNFKKYESIKFSSDDGLYSFVIMILFSILALYLYIEFTYVRYLFLAELIVFLFYLHIFY